MDRHPTLQTERLVLRPLALTDAGDVQRLAGDRAIADTTATIPHPYPDGEAEKWIAEQHQLFDAGELVNFAVALREDEDTVIGVVGLLRLSKEHERGELGYWIGRPYWGEGYCTEAARAVVDYGFTTLRLHRIHASFLARNPASGRVLEKIGMTREGCLRRHDKKWDAFEDLVLCGILRSEWDDREAPAS